MFLLCICCFRRKASVDISNSIKKPVWSFGFSICCSRFAGTKLLDFFNLSVMWRICFGSVPGNFREFSNNLLVWCINGPSMYYFLCELLQSVFGDNYICFCFNRSHYSFWVSRQTFLWLVVSEKLLQLLFLGKLISICLLAPSEGHGLQFIAGDPEVGGFYAS